MCTKSLMFSLMLASFLDSWPEEQGAGEAIAPPPFCILPTEIKIKSLEITTCKSVYSNKAKIDS